MYRTQDSTNGLGKADVPEVDAGQTDDPRGSLASIFTDQARRTPGRIALISSKQELSYAELDLRSSQLAGLLQEAGVGPRHVVGILAQRALETPAAILAVLKSGAAYLPLDPGLPESRLAFMVQLAEAKLVLAGNDADAQWCDRLADVIPIAITSLPNESDLVDSKWDYATVDDLAYVMFTSGSTGEPKGVAMPHGALMNLVQWQQSQSGDNSIQRTLQFAPFWFDVSFQEMFTTWAEGGTLVIADDATRHSPKKQLDLLSKHSIERMFLPPVALEQLAQEAIRRGVLPGSLREVITAGEPLKITRDIRAFFGQYEECRLINHYGPTESHVVTSFELPPAVAKWPMLPPIGKPIANAEVHLVTPKGKAAEIGEEGEICIAGTPLAQGYVNRKELTDERFVEMRLPGKAPQRMYRTGDIGRCQEDGNIEFLGRADGQLKIRGVRIEPAEIELPLQDYPEIDRCSVSSVQSEGQEAKLVAYYTNDSYSDIESDELRRFLAGRLPEALIPARFVRVDELPRTATGKVDRKALPEPSRERPTLAVAFQPPRTEVERQITQVWQQALNLEQVGVLDNFFDLGGDSLSLLRVARELSGMLPEEEATTLLFEHPTIRSLADAVKDRGRTAVAPEEREHKLSSPRETTSDESNDLPSHAIAIVGMAGRFPGAANIDEFWNNIRQGVVSISPLSDSQLLDSGVSPQLIGDPDYVKARGILDDAEQFEPELFGLTPRDAETSDPQQRVFMECCWQALEDAACDPARYDGRIGVFAGASFNTYMLSSLLQDRAKIEQLVHEFQVGQYQTLVGNDKDYLSSRVAYALNLRGPAVTVQTACSTSLVAVVEACESLWQGNCDAALAGGVSISFPQHRGYLYSEGGMVSSDGRCRPFDANATGTVFGSGAGVVMLKRLDDAIAAGDPIHAVIRGAAMNNDGSAKVGYAAPSVEGQATVIRDAISMAGVAADSISYVEAHGTATPLGDPIEAHALAKAFESEDKRPASCALGSVKANIGHLESSSGVAGLIKTALALRHAELPPTANFERPNPKLQLDSTPFYVSSELRAWDTEGSPRRAGVSSLGVGGTNAHVVLEEPPRRNADSHSSASQTSGYQLLPLSGRTPEAVAANAAQLTKHLRQNSLIALADVAHTLAMGRKELEVRRTVVCRDRSDAIESLEALGESMKSEKTKRQAAGPVVFMFPGQVAESAGMAAALYRNSEIFRTEVDRCAELLLPHLEVDIRDVLCAEGPYVATAQEMLKRNEVAQTSLFAVEYALAQQWMAWGVQPDAAVGHSLGQFVAATLAGVFTLEDVLALLVERGKLMQAAPAGAMLAVAVPEEEAAKLTSPVIEVASVNGTSRCVLTGTASAIDELEKKLQDEDVMARRLDTTRAFHSHLMEGAAKEFAVHVGKLKLSTPELRCLSNVSGTWMTADEATDAAAWGRHLRHTVRFGDCINTVLKESPDAVFIEVGPGHTLTSFARNAGQPVHTLTSMTGETDGESSTHLLGTLGKLWCSGCDVDLSQFATSRGGQRISLPTYAFQRKRYWVAPKWLSNADQTGADSEPKSTSTATETTQHESPSEEMESHTTTESVVEQSCAAQLNELLQSVVGREIDEDQRDATFLELGFDSLLLVQLAQQLRQTFGIRLSFRQLMEEIRTPAALIEQLEEQAPSTRPPAKKAARSEQPKAPAVRKTSESERPSVKPSASRHGPFRAKLATTPDTLNERQQAALDKLIEEYAAKTGNSKTYAQQHRTHLADPRVVSDFRRAWKEIVYPIVTNKSQGAYLWDVDGNRYVDITLGFGSCMFGHASQFIEEAITAQLKQGYEIGPQSPLAGELAERIAKLTGMQRVAFCNTGSEAVMAALRMARTVTGKSKVVMFSGAYHGTTDEVLVRDEADANDRSAVPVAPGILPSMVENAIVLPYGESDSLAVIESMADELAAVLVEPVQSRRPDLQPSDFLRRLRELTADDDVALIFDEVVTGFRVHSGGVQKMWGIKADIATYGKVVGGGLPIGLVAGSAEYLDSLDGGHWTFGDDSSPDADVTFFAGTFVRHPLAMAAAKAVLDRLENEGPKLQRDLNLRATGLVAELNDVCSELNAPLRFSSFGSVYYPKFIGQQPLSSLFYFHMRLHGVHVWEGRPWFLSTAHSDEDIQAVVHAARASIQAMLDSGLFVVDERDAPADSGSTGVGEALPLTDAQRELWVAAQLSPEANCVYNEACAIDIDGSIDTRAMQAALQSLVDRYDALRTTFSPDGKSQTIHPKSTIELSVVDMSRMNADDQHAERERRRRREMEVPFDLEYGPLVRAQLLNFGNQRASLLLTMHHLVCDGWSFSVLLTAFDELHRAHQSGSALPSQTSDAFAEFASQSSAENESKRSSASYWAEQFSDEIPLVELPTERSRDSRKTASTELVKAELDEPLCERLRSLAANEGVTLNSVLLAAYAVLLERLSGQRDMTIGMPVAGQFHHGQLDLVGHCLNYLPLRLKVAESSVAEHLRAVNSHLSTAIEHFDYTYGNLVEENRRRKSQHHPASIGVDFNVDVEEPDRSAMFGCSTQVQFTPKQYALLDMAMNLVPVGGAFECQCTVNSDVLDPRAVAAWLESYRQILDEFCRDAKGELSAVAALGDSCRTSHIERYNETDRESHTPDTIHDWFAEQVHRTPDSIAVTSGSGRITYSELAERSDHLADHLRGLGVGPDQIVGIYVDRGIEMVAAMLGVLKAGGAYLPLDPEFPEDRLAYMVDDAKCRCVITQGNLGERAASFGAQLVLIDDLPASETESTINEHIEPASGKNLAYVIYTSGSTGRPKGVAIEHRAVVNFLESMRRRPGLAVSDRLLAVTTISFDISVLEVFLPLVVGAEVVVAPRGASADPDQLTKLLEKCDATVMQATPSTWRLMLAAEWQGKQDLRVLCGGEAMPRDLADRLLPLCDSLWNMYGPTETTIWSSVEEVELSDLPVSIGRPIDNTQFYVLDNNDRPTLPGAIGELCIGGEGLAREYLNRPELTQAKFFESKNPLLAGRRLYRTGDNARFRGDGELEVLGRRDQQLKIRGYRVEASEIERVLESHPDIGSAAVVTRQSGYSEPRLAAFVVSTAHAPDTNELREHVAQKLPAYMVPDRITCLEQLPKTNNGKIDRKTLSEYEFAGTVQVDRKAHNEPQGDLETQLARWWCEALRIGRVSRDDDFFELGGHSLDAVVVFTRIRKELGVELPLATLFETPTIAELAAVVAKSHAPEVPATTPVKRAKKKPQFTHLVPLSTQSDDQQPLFLVGGKFGDVLNLYPFSQALVGDRNVYALQARGLKPGETPHVSFEEMAADCLAEVRQVQPHGPYVFGGYCLGGVVGLELARQAIAAGDEVRSVVLLDSSLPVVPKFSIADRVRMQAQLAKRYGVVYPFLWARSRSKWEWQRLSEAVSGTSEDRSAVVATHLMRALFEYRPVPYTGRAVLVRCEPEPWFRLGDGRMLDADREQIFADNNLSQCCPELEVHTVDGDHDSLLVEPRVQQVAKIVDDFLR